MKPAARKLGSILVKFQLKFDVIRLWTEQKSFFIKKDEFVPFESVFVEKSDASFLSVWWILLLEHDQLRHFVELRVVEKSI